jgi:hypothetical protein
VQPAPSHSGWWKQHEARTEINAGNSSERIRCRGGFQDETAAARRHRIAHLRALIGQLPPGSIRGIELMALLRDEMILSCGNNGRAG